jgi:uncharacterized iron-regulated protein
MSFRSSQWIAWRSLSFVGWAVAAAVVIALGLSSAKANVRDLRYFLGSQELEFVLLGEVHDNEQLHNLRQLNLYNANGLFEGRSVVLAMEQFDVARQADLDQFVSALSDAERLDPTTAKKLAQAGGFNFEGWDWPLYERTVQFALRFKLKLVAANLSRSDAMAIARGAVTPLLERFDVQWTPQELARMAKDMQDSHCGVLPEQAIAGMLRAQQARDAQMAQTLLQAQAQIGARYVILLAGNGHVRKDFGVPRYLRAASPRAKIFSWGFVETPLREASSNAVYDEVVGALPERLADPCAGLKERFTK